VANIILVLLLSALAGWRYVISADFVPLHYTVYFGLDRFGPKYDLFLFPTLGLTFFLINLLVIKYAIEDNKLWRGVIYAITLVIEFILLASFVLVILKDMG